MMTPGAVVGSPFDDEGADTRRHEDVDDRSIGVHRLDAHHGAHPAEECVRCQASGFPLIARRLNAPIYGRIRDTVGHG